MNKRIVKLMRYIIDDIELKQYLDEVNQYAHVSNFADYETITLSISPVSDKLDFVEECIKDVVTSKSRFRSYMIENK